MKRVITYGTFDLLHYGHINLLRRVKALGDYLIVALSTDEFNWNEKHKSAISPDFIERTLWLYARLISGEEVDYSADLPRYDIDYNAVEEKLNALHKDSSDFLLNAIESVSRRMAKDNAHSID